MSKAKLILGDVVFGFARARKGEPVFRSLARQGKEVREARRKAFRASVSGRRL
ncbi:hypothetical protein LCGC14_3036940 [marine sediment metagenome]|uniref:Uncharacterized protein n=1 Tax=marine sediment metagenome TaxID=412755 RepID=A0A0F8WQG5_9ZZZZ